jgi:hypothetical protein
MKSFRLTLPVIGLFMQVNHALHFPRSGACIELGINRHLKYEQLRDSAPVEQVLTCTG